MRRIWAFVSAFGVWLLVSVVARSAPAPSADAVPELGPAPALGALAGKPVTRIEVVNLGGRWQRPLTLRRARLGDPLSGELARRAMQELADSGYYAEVRAEAV